jgi:hypothetical protein
MTTYYVRKTGNDGSGDGSTGTPWLTVNKAITTISAGGNHTVNIGAGTYAENNGGYFQITGAFAALVTFQTESGLNDVTILNTSSDYGTILSGPVTNILFKNITFTVAAGSHIVMDMYADSAEVVTGIEFRDCSFIGLPALDNCRVQSTLFNTASETVVFTRCTFTFLFGTNTTYPCIYISTAIAGSTFTFTDCTGNFATSEGLYCNGVTAHVSGGTFTGGTLPMEFGVDGATGAATTGYVRNATITASGNHGLLIGAGTTGVEVSGCTLAAVGMALVLKKGTSNIAKNNTIRGTGNYPTVLIKGAAGVMVLDNQIYSDLNFCIANYDNDPTYTSSNCVILNNTLQYSTTAAYLISWAALGDGGGNVVDFNVYKPYTTRFGLVLGSTITSLTGLRTAWAGYGDGTNDAHSSAFEGTRLITGTLLHADGSAWSGASVILELTAPFETSTAFHPAEVHTETTDINGAFSTLLCIPDTGTAHYLVRFPDDTSHHIYLASGAAVDITSLITV